MGRLRNADLEHINRHIDKHNRDYKGHYPTQGRQVKDEKGRMVRYDIVNGRPQIRSYDDKPPTNGRNRPNLRE